MRKSVLNLQGTNCDKYGNPRDRTGQYAQTEAAKVSGVKEFLNLQGNKLRQIWKPETACPCIVCIAIERGETVCTCDSAAVVATVSALAPAGREGFV